MFQPLVRLSSIVMRSGSRAPILSSAESLTKIIIMGNFLPARSEQILLLGLLILRATYSSDAGTSDPQSPSLPVNEYAKMTDAEWRQRLTPEQFYVCRQKGTEPAFTGEYVNNKQAGTYKCAACGAPLFESETKFDSRSGWPSFFQQYMGKEGKQSIVTKADHTLGMSRTEVLCARCHSHLGHVFPDGPAPTGLRYCINSVALKFEPKKEREL